jgi:hypothetical protein
MDKRFYIGEAAKRIGVSMDTLRRWDKSGILKSHRASAAGHRYYLAEDVEAIIYAKRLKKTAPLVNSALRWATVPEHQIIPSPDQYCPTRDVFSARAERMGHELAKVPELHHLTSLITIIAGEIGNNSFDHNIGNWPDLPGIYFYYDIASRYLVMADRGVGILHTLQRVRPNLQTHRDALRLAFTEMVSGRDPEARGNGLKLIRKVVTENPLRLAFQSGDAKLELQQNDTDLKIKLAPLLRGCLAVLYF